MRHSIPFFLLTLCSAANAFAWGGDGHQITALIAEDHLTPAAKAGIHDLLGVDVNISDAEIASWADVIKRSHRDQGAWHYVDIPVEAKTYDAKRDGRDGANVIAKIESFRKILADKTKPKEDREHALRFLVHLVGDLHQPLHCAERNNDHGGNAVKILFLARTKPVNLHECWDSLILISHKGRTRNADYADTLNATITDIEVKEWSQGAPEDWANQSHAIAVKVIYHDTPLTALPTKMGKGEVEKYAPIIDGQLERGGLRLAVVLNLAFK